MTRPNVVFDFAIIEMAFDFANFDDRSNDAYLDRHTGESLYFSSIGDSDEEPEDFDDTTRYLAIPDTRDFGLGSQLAVDFVSNSAPHLLDDVRDFFRRRGGFKRFKNLLEHNGLLDDWHQYEADRERVAILRWCDENDIRYTDTASQTGG